MVSSSKRSLLPWKVATSAKMRSAMKGAGSLRWRHRTSVRRSEPYISPWASSASVMPSEAKMRASPGWVAMVNSSYSELGNMPSGKPSARTIVISSARQKTGGTAPALASWRVRLSSFQTA